jgi:hypothetical protein
VEPLFIHRDPGIQCIPNKLIAKFDIRIRFAIQWHIVDENRWTATWRLLAITTCQTPNCSLFQLQVTNQSKWTETTCSNAFQFEFLRRIHLVKLVLGSSFGTLSGRLYLYLITRYSRRIRHC